MIECPSIEKRVIQNHYDVATLFYRMLWGKHIHHGYWEADEDPKTAAVQLMMKLAEAAEIHVGSDVIDIGCGMGGSSLWLAKNMQCRVTGVTISSVQRAWAATASRFSSSVVPPRFLCVDAEEVEFDRHSADCVWSIECTEHLFNKPAFFQKAAGWIRPGGCFALCAWLAGEAPLDTAREEQVKAVCRGMFCPSLGTLSDYRQWFEESGLMVRRSGLWTKSVLKTWEICRRRVERSGVRRLAKILGKNHMLFLDHFDAILEAYRSGAMEYGYFVAEKPA
jgi:tocopherol O-methyltransferase